jgi:hypothetical protein
MPLDLLRRHGVDTGRGVGEILAAPGFAEACVSLAAEVRERYARVAGTIPPQSRRALRPAFIMMLGYERIFAKLLLRGWQRRGARPRLSKAERLKTVARAFTL